jgi:hypothetical protein
MYKTAIEYYKELSDKSIEYSYYQGPQRPVQHIKESYIDPVETVDPVDPVDPVKKTGCPHITWKTSKHSSLSDPKVWGPAFWFTLHNGADKYPESASPIVKSRMKSYILGIPIMLPCAVCQIHATNHIEKNKNKLDDICYGRKNLFKFFVDFHNIVNKRYNKPIVSVEEAYKIYGGGANVSVMSFS